MIEESFRTHRNNVQRYRKLLEARLTDHERQFIQRRLLEEQSAIEALAAMTIPPIFKDPTSTQDPSGSLTRDQAGAGSWAPQRSKKQSLMRPPLNVKAA